MSTRLAPCPVGLGPRVCPIRLYPQIQADGLLRRPARWPARYLLLEIWRDLTMRSPRVTTHAFTMCTYPCVHHVYLPVHHVYLPMRSPCVPTHAFTMCTYPCVHHVPSMHPRLFTMAGMAVSPLQMEPLQLVKYASSERFGPHHDCAPAAPCLPPRLACCVAPRLCARHALPPAAPCLLPRAPRTLAPLAASDPRIPLPHVTWHGMT